MSGKIGVLLCNCGLALDKAVSFPRLQELAASLDGVGFAATVPDLCMKTGEIAVLKAVAAHGLDRLVMASCSVRTHGPMLRAMAARCGVNPFLVELVDLKGVAASTAAQAVDDMLADLLRMATARVGELEPLTRLAQVPERSFLVIGGGVAGVAAAAATAAAGIPTTVVEKTGALGGRAGRVTVELPGAGLSAAEVKRQVEALKAASCVTLLLNSTVTGVSGGVGRYVASVATPEGPVEVMAGAVLLATGNPTLPPAGLYGASAAVISQDEFESRLSKPLSGVSSVAFIQCAGARCDSVPYCSRSCCMVALKQAIFVKRTYPATDVRFLFRDIQVGGSELTKLVYHAPKWGVKFHRFDPASPPIVAGGKVQVKDSLTNSLANFPADLVVLATPTTAGAETRKLGEQLGLAVDANGFVAEPLMRARPVDHPDRGVLVAGNAHWPCNMKEAVKQGQMAASRVMQCMEKPVANHPAVAFVDKAKCIACGLCERTCGSEAIRVVTTRDGMKAQVDYGACKGCGTCVGGCPVFAITAKHYTDKQVRAQVAAGIGPARLPAQAAAAEQAAASGSGAVQAGGKHSKLLAFCCQWGGYASAEMAAAEGKKLPSGLRIVRLTCTGRVDPTHVIDALSDGYAGVAVVGCDRKICRYETGNWFAASRIEWLQALLSEFGFSPDRLVMGFADSEKAEGILSVVEPFSAKVVPMGSIGTAEGIPATDVQHRLALLRRLFESKELRWLVGQETSLSRAGADCFGRPFDRAAFRGKVSAVTRRVLSQARVLEALKSGPLVLAEVSRAAGELPRDVLAHAVDLIATGLLELGGTKDRFPVFRSLEQQQQQ